MTVPINVRWTGIYVPHRSDPFIHRVHMGPYDGTYTACGRRFPRHLIHLWTHTKLPATCLWCVAAP